ncbi:MAG: HU family DNA-binding protein [Acidimicrobiia bacterium]|nr:HU family DNA-binding protein [Acidimicrobiia bacterium]
MNKTELVAAIADRTSQSKVDVDATVKALVDVVTETVSKGDGEVTIPGFLSVKKVHREAREAWNPAKGERQMMPATNAVKVSAGSKLKAAVKEG